MTRGLKYRIRKEMMITEDDKLAKEIYNEVSPAARDMGEIKRKIRKYRRARTMVDLT